MKSTLDQFKLNGRCALVTGGYGNLGPYWTFSLLSAGAVVVILNLPGVSMSTLYTSLNKNLKRQLFFFEADVTNPTELQEIHKKILKKTGPVDILVNNAGIDIPPGSYTVDSVRMWRVNVEGVVNCIEEFSRDMKKNKKGSIINIGSLYMERSPFGGLYTHLSADKPWMYGSTKAAVGQVTRHFATRLAKYGIRVNTLSPGGVMGNQDKEFIRKYSERVPMNRLADRAKDLGGPLVFLASDASSYITRINLPFYYRFNSI